MAMGGAGGPATATVGRSGTLHLSSTVAPKVATASKTMVRGGTVVATPFTTSATPFVRTYPSSIAFGLHDTVLNPPNRERASHARSTHSKKAVTVQSAGTVHKVCGHCGQPLPDLRLDGCAAAAASYHTPQLHSCTHARRFLAPRCRYRCRTPQMQGGTACGTTPSASRRPSRARSPSIWGPSTAAVTRTGRWHPQPWRPLKSRCTSGSASATLPLPRTSQSACTSACWTHEQGCARRFLQCWTHDESADGSAVLFPQLRRLAVAGCGVPLQLQRLLMLSEATEHTSRGQLTCPATCSDALSLGDGWHLLSLGDGRHLLSLGDRRHALDRCHRPRPCTLRRSASHTAESARAAARRSCALRSCMSRAQCGVKARSCQLSRAEGGHDAYLPCSCTAITCSCSFGCSGSTQVSLSQLTSWAMPFAHYCVYCIMVAALCCRLLQPAAASQMSVDCWLSLSRL